MSVKINNAIYSILSGSTAVTNLVGDKLYPIAVDEKVKSPFVVYERSSLNPEYTKDGLSNDIVKVKVSCTSNKYSESLNIIDACRNALELKSGTFSGVKILQCVLEDSKEDCDTANYYQYLFFSIITTK